MGLGSLRALRVLMLGRNYLSRVAGLEVGHGRWAASMLQTNQMCCDPFSDIVQCVMGLLCFIALPTREANDQFWCWSCPAWRCWTCTIVLALHFCARGLGCAGVLPCLEVQDCHTAP